MLDDLFHKLSMFMRNIQDVGEVPLRLNQQSTKGYTADKVSDLIKSICLSRAFEMVFKPERNRDNKSLNRIQPVLLGTSGMALRTDSFTSAKSETSKEVTGSNTHIVCNFNKFINASSKDFLSLGDAAA
jgi:hypothetical protein